MIRLLPCFFLFFVFFFCLFFLFCFFCSFFLCFFFRLFSLCKDRKLGRSADKKFKNLQWNFCQLEGRVLFSFTDFLLSKETKIYYLQAIFFYLQRWKCLFCNSEHVNVSRKEFFSERIEIRMFQDTRTSCNYSPSRKGRNTTSRTQQNVSMSISVKW